jgi:hypothetical protein
MKNFILALVVIFVQQVTAQEAEVRKSITDFFEGMHAKDTLKIKSVCAEGLILQSVSEQPAGSKLSNENINSFYRSIAAIPASLAIEERLLGYTIKIDGALAHAWTPYEFYVKGKLSHTGTNSFTLFNDKGKWKIIHIIDTRKMAK